MRTPDRGSTTGAASWTDRARSERAAPKGRAKRVNPPLTAIFKKEFVRKYGLFFALPPRRLPDDGAIYKRLIRLPQAQRHQANY
ncbi:hypothetical protein BSL44_04110 [Salmonella enterica subsp. enterica serovar Alachua]|uniref:Uncharacterized protein n=2 Tax=Salmonella enterica I TaxID=59201 RepID=A0A3V3S0Q8_SALET|nr:hypothetical protein [Salmonella enterica subsp. arizonae]EAA7636364.1 hypothetical protein [Salmonella enterica subsp. enterica]EAA9182678.1 hypothetical protein [Salmonella enterica]EBL0014529.1 hypothetical protein [Salmonella enterica subsp. enterica serovar Alachua]EAM3018410.1 hypothetical protein [Salmonella enterica]